MSLLKIRGVIVRQPNLAVCVLPDQRLQRQIDRSRRRGLHQRRPAFGTAEDQQLRWPHRKADLRRLAAVVDQGEDHDALLLQEKLESLRRLVYGVLALQMD